jgi:hypothetical protein
MWPVVLEFIMRAIPVIPSLVTDIENLWRGKPKAGASKWISIEQALSGTIADTAKAVIALAPAGTKPEFVSQQLVIFAKSVNDASVALANALQVFPHAGNSPAVPAPPSK